ncbi:MAG: LacI family DNA-binding transcriptional regulator [Rectinemataceae bacterium]
MDQNNRVTIADIAARANVSKTTVSRVLNDKPDVDKETRCRILDIIRDTGFVPQMSAISLAKGKTGLIGLVVPSLTNPYSLTVIQGVAEGIAETDYELVLYTTGLMEKNQKRFIQRLTSNVTDGLVVLLPRNFEEYGDELLKTHFPIVLVDHRGVESEFPSITAANRPGAYEATHYLISLGHRRIGFVTGLMDFGCSRDRLDGYRDALRDAGIDFDPALIAPGDFSQASGKNSAAKLLGGPHRPTAIFCSNDEMAFGAIAAAREAGLNIPDDLSVIGFDDLPSAAFSVPALTTVRQPLHAMGRSAASLLLRQISGEASDDPLSKEVTLETSLVLRDTCSKS